MGIKSWFPLEKENFKADLMTGLTVALFLIPQSMAYAELAGLPAYYGLYASFIPVLIGAIFGHLHQLGIGPTAMTSIMTASVLSLHAPPGSPDYIRLAIVLGLCAGIIRLLVGLFKAASFTNMIRKTVITGFTSAGALIIMMSQLSKILGISVDKSHRTFGAFLDFWRLLTQLDETAIMPLAFGIGTILIILLLKKISKKIPAVLLTISAAIVLSWILKYPEYPGGDILGSVPRGFPPINLFGQDGFSFSLLWSDIKMVFPGSILVVLISMMEVLSVSKAVSEQTGQEMDLNKELVGQGLAAVAGSFTSAFPTGGSFSRTALNLMTGGKTGLNIVFTSLIVMVILLFFTPLLFFLPLSALAASIVISIVKLFKPKALIEYWKENKLDGITGFVTFISTLIFAPSIQVGILTGIGISVVFHFVKKYLRKRQGLNPLDADSNDL